MTKQIPRVIIAGAVLAAVATAAPAAAVGLEGGVTAVTLAEGTARDGVVVRSPGYTDVVVRTIKIAPGGTTGWHWHPGRLIAVVRAGTLTRIDSRCRVHTNRAGQAFVELNGEVHIGVNRGPRPIELTVTYVKPSGSPLSLEARPPSCYRPMR